MDEGDDDEGDDEDVFYIKIAASVAVTMAAANLI